MLLDSPSATIKHNSALVSFVENIKNQQHDQTTPLLNSPIKPYGLTDTTTNSCCS